MAAARPALNEVELFRQRRGDVVHGVLEQICRMVAELPALSIDRRHDIERMPVNRKIERPGKQLVELVEDGGVLRSLVGPSRLVLAKAEGLVEAARLSGDLGKRRRLIEPHPE